MSIDDLVKWTSLAMPLVLGVSTLIAVFVYRFTRRVTRLQTLNLVHSRWHEINRILIERPALQRLLGDPRFTGKTDEEIVVFNLAFQIVNICFELHVAARDGLIDRTVADAAVRSSLAALQGRPDLLGEILGANPLFDEEFRARLATEGSTGKADRAPTTHR